jgi:hypothetical protein
MSLQQAEIDHGISQITAAFAEKGQPASAYAAFDRVVERLVGRVFSTVLKRRPGWEIERIYSSDEQNYPAGGMKPLPDNARTRRLYKEGRAFFARGDAQIMAEHPDSRAAIAGADTVANFPVIYDGEVVATVNLGGRHWADQTEVERVVMQLVQALAPTVALTDRGGPVASAGSGQS